MCYDSGRRSSSDQQQRDPVRIVQETHRRPLNKALHHEEAAGCNRFNLQERKHEEHGDHKHKLENIFRDARNLELSDLLQFVLQESKNTETNRLVVLIGTFLTELSLFCSFISVYCE